MLVLAVLIAPIAHYAGAVNAQVPIINFMLVIFETIHIRISLIKVFDTSSTPVDVRVVLTIILIPVVAAVLLQKATISPSFNLGT
jgi:hypothetical protein